MMSGSGWVLLGLALVSSIAGAVVVSALFRKAQGYVRCVAYPGDILLCPEGHEVCEVAEPVKEGRLRADLLDLKTYRGSDPSVRFPRCPQCRVNVMAPYMLPRFAVRMGWRPPPPAPRTLDGDWGEVAFLASETAIKPPYELYDYSAYPGDKPPHVIKDTRAATRGEVFRTKDPAEASDAMRRLSRLYAGSVMVSALSPLAEDAADLGIKEALRHRDPREALERGRGAVRYKLQAVRESLEWQQWSRPSTVPVVDAPE